MKMLLWKLKLALKYVVRSILFAYRPIARKMLSKNAMRRFWWSKADQMWRLTEAEFMAYKDSAKVQNLTEQKFNDACNLFGHVDHYGLFAWPCVLTRGTPFQFGLGYSQLNPVIYGTSINVQEYCQCALLIMQYGKDWTKAKVAMNATRR